MWSAFGLTKGTLFYFVSGNNMLEQGNILAVVGGGIFYEPPPGGELSSLRNRSSNFVDISAD